MIRTRFVVRAIAVVAVAFVAGSAQAQGTTGGVGSLWRPATSAAPKAATKPKSDSTAKTKDSSSKVAPKAKAVDSTTKVTKVTKVVDSAKVQAAPAVVAPTTVAKPDVTATKAVTTPADATVALVAALQFKVDSLQAAQTAAGKQAAATAQATNLKLAGLGNFKFTGDLRVRYEGQFQSGGFVTRHRERTRGRLVVGANVTDDLSAALGIATGSLDDVQSPNQTETGFFARKTIGFDRFFVTWKPKAINGFAITAGKFPYAWDRTQLTFGNDINPEGVAPSYTRTTKGALQSATVVGFVLPFLEVAGGDDSYAFGGQFQTKWRVSSRINARASAASVSFHGTDAIAQAVVATTIKPGAPIANRFRTDSTGKTIGYQAGFAYTDLIGAIDYIASAHWPITVQADVVRNRKGGLNEDTGVLSELKVGRLSQIKDAQVTWNYYRVERDAVIGAFNEQDLRAATNVLSHKLTVAYQWQSNATLSVGAWYGKLLDPFATPKLATAGYLADCVAGKPTCRDPWLSRIQLDLSYRF